MEEARILNLEQRTATLGDSINRVEHKVDNIADTLNSLVRIEERQIAINARLAEGSQTMQDHEGRLKNIEVALPSLVDDAKDTKDHEIRIKAVEVIVPGLVEKSGWVVKGLLGVIGAVGMQIVHMVLSK